MKHLMASIVFALVDIVCFLQGSIIFIYALLHFNYKMEVVRGDSYYALEGANIPATVSGYYYYHDSFIKIAMIGVALIITGFLMRSWRKEF